MSADTSDFISWLILCPLINLAHGRVIGTEIGDLEWPWTTLNDVMAALGPITHSHLFDWLTNNVQRSLTLGTLQIFVLLLLLLLFSTLGSKDPKG